MSSKTSLDEKLSDLVGSANYNLTENFKINYNFSIDQNYQDFNYNEIGTSINYGALELDFNYLHENKHIGDQDYFKSNKLLHWQSTKGTKEDNKGKELRL